MTWTGDDPAINGTYWWRADKDDPEPEIHDVLDGKFYETGKRSFETVENYGGQWLGPITPAHAELLDELVDTLGRVTGCQEPCGACRTRVDALLNRAKQVEGRG